MDLIILELVELFDYLLYYANYPRGSRIIVYTDSQYARDLLLGSSIPTSHPQLVHLAQQYFVALRTQYHVDLRKVPSHVGIPGNEIADRQAKQGIYTRSTLGRFSTTPAASLSPPDMGYNFDIWSHMTVEAQDETFTKLMTQSLALVPCLPLAAKKPWISSHTRFLIKTFQQTHYTDLSQLKLNRKRIKKSARNDKKLFISNNLYTDFHVSNVNQWRHTRQIKSEFRPRSTGLFDVSGSLVSKDKRASTFADYLAQKVWFSSSDPVVPAIAQYDS